MISVIRPKVDHVVVRKGATAMVVPAPRSAVVRVVQSAAPPHSGDIQITDLLAAYILARN